MCRMCEKPVREAAVPEHSRCCAAMRDADLRALAAGADIAGRIAAAAAAMAEVLDREISPEESDEESGSAERKPALRRVRDSAVRAPPKDGAAHLSRPLRSREREAGVRGSTAVRGPSL